MDNIKISIVIPAYNIENTIERTLLSIVPQLTSNTELIVVNDGSTDLTKSKIENIIRRTSNKNIKIIDTENEGALFARLNGFKIALGEYIWFIDGGDTITNDSISTITNALRTSSDIYHLNSITLPTNEISRYTTENVTCSDLLLGKVPFSIWARVFKKKLLEESAFDKLKKTILGEDICLSYLITEKADRTENIDKIIYEYHLDENSLSHNRDNDITIVNALEFLKTRSEILNLDNEFDYFSFSQIIVKYLLLSNNKAIAKELLKYYHNLNINNNKYIKYQKLCELGVKIKIKSDVLDRIITKIVNYIIR